MYYFIPLTILFVAIILKVVASNFNIKTLGLISNIIIIICVILAVYFYLDYRGINIFEMIKKIKLW